MFFFSCVAFKYCTFVSNSFLSIRVLSIRTKCIVQGVAGESFYQVRARLALLQGQFKQAEQVYLEENAVGEMLEVYRALFKWDELLQLAEAKRLPELDTLKQEYYQWLMQTGQEEKAGEVRLSCFRLSLVLVDALYSEF